MAAPPLPHVVVMGVSGSGKSTVATLLAERLGADFLDGDAVHPPANVAAMSAGIPLTDADRLPWLGVVRDWLAARADLPGVVACSALRRSYREVLREAGDVWFVHLDVDEAELARRVAGRAGHFMPTTLLASQLATVEPLGADEPGCTVSDTGTVEDLVGQVVHLLSGRSAPGLPWS